MEIRYHHETGENLNKQTEIHWKYLSKKVIKTIYVLLAFFVISLACGIFLKTAHEIDFGNFMFSIGIASGFMSMLLLLGHRENREKWFDSNTSKYYNDFPRECIITDKSISVKTPEVISEMSWNVVSGYRHHDNFIFIYIRNYQTIWVWIEKKYVSEKEFSDLLSFLSMNIPLKDQQGS